MTKRKPSLRTKAVARVPQTREECVADIAQIGQHERDRKRLEAAMNDELSKVRERWEAEARIHAEAIERLSRGVQTYCEARRDELTQGGKVKTFAFASGEIRWRAPPPSVSLRGVDAIIKAFEDRGLGRYLRKKTEVNKEAILADPADALTVKGVSINQDEDFVIVPWDTTLECVA